MTAASAARPLALVTGATSGIGAAIAEELASTHDLVVVGRNEPALAAWASRDGVTALRLDLSDPEGFAVAIAPLGIERLDVLVHAAAIATGRAVGSASVQDWREHLVVDLIAPAELTRLLLPAVTAAQGDIVFIGSGAGTRPVPGSAVYAAAKHGLRGLADSLRIEVEPDRVRVVTVAPGQTDTPLLRSGVEASGGTPEPERYIRPESVARAVRFVVDQGPDTQITDVAVRPRQELVRL
ncbi:SDR family oxidoreductase [Mycetocola reblochoni]|uniref:Short-chain dehydrogenase/reductase SDR n=2 Tax=Mycetocola reblochoni TaxID=331618 RepID=A0A1R4K5Z7_9MICO|nr:SDR family oxidoreductase [Mycetocola reblochoni]RLP68015.1 SDR family oxidoreductase [Mycetocola reblochoni]SJN39604.1 short-chain dehydrogenase/reductase SDR [Mycetocola reblochoni REB411]